jgi:Xaa-Pro aminopeptidase
MSNRQRRIALGLSRRQLMQGAAASVGGPFLLAAAPGLAAEPALEPFALATARFSRAERDRRWAAVRAAMARPHWALDAIITPSSDRSGDYARYLTQIANRPGSGSGPECIFPRDAAQPVYVQLGAARNRAIWAGRLGDWTGDGKLVISEKDGPAGLIPELKARGLDRPGARIGVARLAGSRFDPDGFMSVTTLAALKAALPGAEFLPIDEWGADAGPVEESAMLKGPEEHEVVRRAAAASEHGLATIVASIRGGAKRQADIWFAAYSAMFARTGEDPTRLSIGLDQPANATIGEPVADAVRDGQIVLQEIDATVAGYRAQVNHAIFVGNAQTPGYGYYRAGIDIAAGIIADALTFIQPGKTSCGDLVRRYLDQLAAAGAEDASGVMIHSSGIGNLSRPRVGPGNSERDFPIILRPGMCFDLKPAFRLTRARMADAGPRNREIQLGEHLLVTASGAVRLGTRPLGPITTG